MSLLRADRVPHHHYRILGLTMILITVFNLSTPCLVLGRWSKAQTVSDFAVLRQTGRLIRGDNTFQLPLGFEAQGREVNSGERFLTRSQGFGLLLTPTEALLTLSRNAESRPATAPARVKQVSTTVHLKFCGANPRSPAIGQDKLEKKSNYLLGHDPRQWRTNIENYARVRFGDVYPGIDLVYHGNQRQVEYDFIVAPGSDPSSIMVEMASADTLEIDAQGDLLLNIGGILLRQVRPTIYQEIEGSRKPISGGYKLINRRQLGFQIGPYDHDKPLIIDPVLVYSTYVGGSGADESAAITTDAEGNAYVVGTTDSDNFPSGTEAYQSIGSGGKEVFVTKLKPNGTGVVYSTYLGGGLDDNGYGIAIDSAGNAYVTGTTASSNFPTTTGAMQTSNGGGTDAFVAKLNPTGSALVYSTYLGGSGNEEGLGIVVNSSGNAYLTGITASTNFTTTSGVVQSALAGPTDAFVTKLNSNGTSVIFSTYLGGSGAEVGFGIALDAKGSNVYVTGVTDSTNYPTTIGAVQTISAGGSDGFVTKLDDTASTVTYSTLIGGGATDAGLGIGVDESSNAFVTGLTESANFPVVAGAVQGINGGGASDAFALKVNTSGSALTYSTYLGGSGADVGAGIALDFNGNAYVTGTTNSSNFVQPPGVTPPSLGGSDDAFVLLVNKDGTALTYYTNLGGAQTEESFGIAVRLAGDAYVTGTTKSTDYPTTTGAFQSTTAGGPESFVTRVTIPLTTPFQLLLDPSSPAITQVAALDSMLLLRDPFPVVNTANLLNQGLDRNTRIVVFVMNLQLAQGETSSSVIVNLIDSNNQSHDIAAEDVRLVSDTDFTQVIFRLPNNVPAGTCIVKIKAHGEVSNAGTIRIRI
jgi:Beta-propeller repeat